MRSAPDCRSALKTGAHSSAAGRARAFCACCRRTWRALLAALRAPRTPGPAATPHNRTAPRSSNPDAANDKATAKLLGAALGSDVELGGISTGYAPRWVQASESIRSEMVVLKERITKLRE